MNPLEKLLQFIDAEQLWDDTFIGKRFATLPQEEPKLYLLLSGAAIVTIDLLGDEQIIRLGYKNSVLSKLDEIIESGNSKYQIKAIKDCKFISVSVRKLKEKLENKDNLTLWISVLEHLILQQSEREIDLLHTSANLRFERLLKRSPRVFQEIPHKYIASYLRISPETLSRLLKS